MVGSRGGGSQQSEPDCFRAVSLAVFPAALDPCYASQLSAPSQLSNALWHWGRSPYTSYISQTTFLSDFLLDVKMGGTKLQPEEEEETSSCPPGSITSAAENRSSQSSQLTLALIPPSCCTHLWGWSPHGLHSSAPKSKHQLCGIPFRG